MGGLTPLVQSRPAGGGGAFACSDLSACSIANLGTKGHGLLDDLLTDHHTQYALASKARPSPWVAAGDLSARSIADLGTKDHDLLGGLLDDDHTVYGLLSGRSGGQSFKGGSAASEHLTLQSTAHATRGYVRAQDDLQLLSNIMRDSGGNNRVQLATALPHVTLGGNVRLGDTVSVGVAPDATMGLKLMPSLPSSGNKYVIGGNPNLAHASGTASVYGLQTMALSVISVGATLFEMSGLNFTAAAGGAGTATSIYAAWVRAGLAFYSGAASTMWGLKVRSPMLLVSTWPVASYGIEIDDQGLQAGSSHNAIGLRINDQTVTTGNKYLIEAGPAVPYLRLVGGGAPGAGLSNLWVNFAGVLKQVQEDAANTAGAGFRRLRVVN